MYQKIPRRREPSRVAVEPGPTLSYINPFQHNLDGFEAGEPTSDAGRRNVASPTSISMTDSLIQTSERWNRTLGAQDKKSSSVTINVQSDDFAMVKMVAEHAGAAPLAIILDEKNGIQKLNSKSWHHILSKSETWGSLSLRSSVYSEKAPLIAALARPAPELESLQIHNLYFDAPVKADTSDYKTFLLPCKLFAERAACLRDVSIINVYFPSSFSFRAWEQLTRLCVHQNVEKHQDILSYSARWLEILSEMPRLETLNIGLKTNSSMEALPNFLPRSNFESMSDVCLGHLRHLEFETSHGHSLIALRIISKLVIQVNCNIQLFLKPDIRLLVLEIAIERLVKRWRSAFAPVVTRWFTNQAGHVSQVVFGFEVAAPSIKNAVLKVTFEGSDNSRMRAYELYDKIRALSNR